VYLKNCPINGHHVGDLLYNKMRHAELVKWV